MSILDRRFELAQIGLERLDRARRAIEELMTFVLVLGGRTDRRDDNPRAEPLVGVVGAADEHDRARLARVTCLVDAVEHDRVDGRGAVGELEPQQLGAITSGARLHLGQQQRRRELGARLKMSELVHLSGDDTPATGRHDRR
jgi:hypothetical protein